MNLTFGPQVSPATGEDGDVFVLTNDSGRSCVVDGYPSVSLIERGRQLSFAYSRGGWPYMTTAEPRAVTLVPGGRAYFLVAKYRCDGGILHRATLIRVRPPGVRGALEAGLSRGGVSELGYCRRYPGDPRVDPGNRVTVSPIEASLQAALAPPPGSLPAARLVAPCS
jgi:hypothetical protein